MLPVVKCNDKILILRFNVTGKVLSHVLHAFLVKMSLRSIAGLSDRWKNCPVMLKLLSTDIFAFIGKKIKKSFDIMLCVIKTLTKTFKSTRFLIACQCLLESLCLRFEIDKTNLSRRLTTFLTDGPRVLRCFLTFLDLCSKFKFSCYRGSKFLILWDRYRYCYCRIRAIEQILYVHLVFHWLVTLRKQLLWCAPVMVQFFLNEWTINLHVESNLLSWLSMTARLAENCWMPTNISAGNYRAFFFFCLILRFRLRVLVPNKPF